MASLVWGENVPTIHEQDPRLNNPIVNLSGLPLTSDQLEVLKFSLGFRITMTVLPQLKFMAGIESATADLRHQNYEQSEWFCSETARILAHAKLPACNLTPNLQRAAKQLRENTQLVITSADKGGRVVVLFAEHYAEMCGVHLEDQAYEKVESFGKGRYKVHSTDPRTNLPVQVLNENFTTPDLLDRLQRWQCSRLKNLLAKLMSTQDIQPSDYRRLSPSSLMLVSFPAFTHYQKYTNWEN